jgi:hypothetical protein
VGVYDCRKDKKTLGVECPYFYDSENIIKTLHNNPEKNNYQF